MWCFYPAEQVNSSTAALSLPFLKERGRREYDGKERKRKEKGNFYLKGKERGRKQTEAAWKQDKAIIL